MLTRNGLGGALGTGEQARGRKVGDPGCRGGWCELGAGVEVEGKEQTPRGMCSGGAPPRLALVQTPPGPLPAPVLYWPGPSRGSHSLCCCGLNRSVILVAVRPPGLMAVTLA